MLKAFWSKALGRGHERANIERLAMGDLMPEEFVRLAYLVLLRRQLDPVGLDIWRDHISRGMFSHGHVVDSLLSSDEYQRQFGAHVNQRLHAARQAWVKTLPAFNRLLDIGGSSPSHAEGTLIQLGYPHRPKSLDILDLPPDRQNWGTPSYDQSVPTSFGWGTVSYFHGCGEDVANVEQLQGRTYDGIFLGQAVEHIRPEALPGVLDWIRIHLAPGGRLIMDTPNRLMTKIQCPTWYIHPDHKLEYEPAQLESVLVEHGFAVTKRIGLVHLPGIARNETYDAREFIDAPLLHADVDACYLFAFEAAAR
jgi:hypothetical protein